MHQDYHKKKAMSFEDDTFSTYESGDLDAVNSKKIPGVLFDYVGSNGKFKGGHLRSDSYEKTEYGSYERREYEPS